MSSSPGDFYSLAEKVANLEEAVNSLGNEMQGKINFILEYFSSVLEEQTLIQKRCERNSTRFKQLRLKCETRKGRSEMPETLIIEPISTSTTTLGLNSKKIQDAENTSLVPLRPPPPLQVSSQLLENIRSLQTQPPRSQQVRDRHHNLTSSLSKIDASREELSQCPELNPFLGDIRSVDLPLRTEGQILPECQTYTNSCSSSDNIERDGLEMEEAVTMTTSLQHGNEEFDRVGTCDSLRDLTHLSEFVPGLNRRDDLQFESVFISGSVKTEPEYFESADDQMDNSTDNDQCDDQPDQLSDANMNSTLLPGMLGPDADMESYRILGSDEIEGDGIESTADVEPGSTRTRIRPRKYKKLRLRNTIYQCPLCPKCYKTANNLRIHLRGHTGERPYSCPDCDRSFADPSNLRKHMKKNYHLCLRKPRPRSTGIEIPTISVPAGQIHGVEAGE